MEKKKKKSFEEALEELEEIAARLSSGDMGLDESIKLFEKGMELKKFLSEKLKKARASIKIIMEKEGDIEEEDFKVE